MGDRPSEVAADPPSQGELLGRAVAVDRRDLDPVGLDDDRDVVPKCTAAAGYRALETRPRLTVPANTETWKRFATTGTAEDIAAARVALDPRRAGGRAKP